MKFLSIRDLKLAESGDNPRRAALAKHLNNAVQAESRRPKVSRVAVSLIGSIMLLGAIGIMTSWMRWLSPFICPMFIVGGVALSVITQRMTIRDSEKQLAATAVAEGFCGCCAYSMEGSDRQPDGCVVCPECGAAWQFQRITRPHWEKQQGQPLFEPPWWKRMMHNIPSSRDQLAPDDKGRFVRVIDANLKLIAPGRLEDWGSQEVKRVRLQTRAVGFRLRMAVSIAPFLGAGFLVVMGCNLLLSATLRSDDYVSLGLFVAGAAILTAIGLMTIYGRAFSNPKRVAPIIRDAGYCACCGLPLGNLPLASDGYKVCPECGASWRCSQVANTA